MPCCAGVGWRPATLFTLASVTARRRVVAWRLWSSCSLLIPGASCADSSFAPPLRTTTLWPGADAFVAGLFFSSALGAGLGGLAGGGVGVLSSVEAGAVGCGAAGTGSVCG